MKTINGFRKSVRTRRTAMVAATAGVLAILVAAAIAPPARAQTGGSANAAKAQDVQKMLQSRAAMQAKNLGLTPDQTKQLVQINGTTLKQMQAIKANPPADKLDEAKALKSIMDSRQAALNKLLTPDQMKKYTATNQQDMASLMTDSMDTDQNLTDAQMDPIDTINLTYLQSMSSALSTPDKIQAIRTLKRAQKAQDNALQQVLTPDQWKQYQALQQQKKQKQ